MTLRRAALYGATAGALGYIAVCGVILHAVNRVDYRRGWYDRPSFPRCLR